MVYQENKESLEKFNREIFPLLQSFETKRKKILYRMIVVEIVLAVILILYMTNFNAVSEFFLKFTAGWFVTLKILIAIAGFWVLFYPFQAGIDFKRKLKEAIIPKIIEKFEPMEYFNQRSIFSDEELSKSTLFSRFNTAYPDDSFSGTHNGVKFRISETALELRGRDNGISVFKGVVISFASNKKIKAKTIVVTSSEAGFMNRLPLVLFAFISAPVIVVLFSFKESFLNSKALELLIPALVFALILAAICSMALIFNNKKKTDVFNTNKKEIRLEDPKFARQFKVYSEDEVEARYLIAPAFMERFLNLTTSFGTQKSKCAFFDNRIMFAISTRRNLFEFGSLYAPVTNLNNVGFFRELMSILDMIDYFKLDEKTGL